MTLALSNELSGARICVAGLTAMASLSGCGPTVSALPEDNVLRERDGYTHQLSLYAVEKTERTERRALRAAQRTCGVHPASRDLFLRIQAGVALAGTHTYLVDCSPSEKDTK